jgi:putative DNA primase/helicase
LRDVHAILCRYARQYAPGRVLAICQLDAEKRLPQIGPLPANLEIAHHNALAGKDLWADVAALVIVGRTAASPEDVEDTAEAVTGEAIERLSGWYPKADAVREMADGSFRSAETDRHPHPVAEAIRWGIVEAQLIQAGGRGRGVNREASNPIAILLMVNTPVPVPVERLISAADLDPTPFDLQMAAGGVAFENPTDASIAYPQLWETRNAAKHALLRDDRDCDKTDQMGPFPNIRSIIRVWPHLVIACHSLKSVMMTYQRSGERLSQATAYVDLSTVPNPKEWLTERLGQLTHFALTEPQNQPHPDMQTSSLASAADERAAERAGNPLAEMIRLGALLRNSVDAVALYPELWTNPEQARQAFARAARDCDKTGLTPLKLHKKDSLIENEGSEGVFVTVSIPPVGRNGCHVRFQ